ncbi:MAG: hypothetical protein JWP11_610 [Frankiales bacterium]|nr:hypothetical protein [Frankiales bacterium]
MTARRTPVPSSMASLAAVLLLCGCGPDTGLDLDLRAVPVTVPRLLTPAVQIVPKAPAPPPAPLPQLPPLPSLVDVLPPAAPPVVAGPLPSAAPVPDEVCPKAGQLDVPDVQASLTVDAPPVPGTTTYTATGAFAATAAQGSLAGPVTVTTTALPAATTLTGQQVESWQVERRAAASTSVELYQLVRPSADPAATASGVYLVGLAWKDDVRGDLVFQPVGDGLHVLPNPVQLAASGGAQYVGAATDPSTLTTLSLTRNVTASKRIDLCGELVETFTVELSGVLTTPEGARQVLWTQQLAPAYGAADVQETLTLTEPTGGFTWTRSLTATEVPVLPKATS